MAETSMKHFDYMTISESIGRIIHNRRLELNFTQDQIAKQLGVTKGTISKWESGKILCVRHDHFESLTDLLGITINVKVFVVKRKEQTQ